MSEGVMSSTVEMAERHPWLVGGALVGVVALLWFASGSKKPAAFNFSYGPSDAQVKAGTALAIAQAGDQTALSLGTIQSADTRSYFDLIANTTANNNAAKVATAGIASNTALGIAGYGVQATALNDSRDIAVNSQNTNRDIQGFAYSAATSQNAANQDANAKIYASQMGYLGLVDTNASNVRISTSKDYTSGVLATIAKG